MTAASWLDGLAGMPLDLTYRQLVTMLSGEAKTHEEIIETLNFGAKARGESVADVGFRDALSNALATLVKRGWLAARGGGRYIAEKKPLPEPASTESTFLDSSIRSRA